MGANALQRALRLVQSNLHGPQDREIMADALERFAADLATRLHFHEAAYEIAMAALNLRKQP